MQFLQLITRHLPAGLIAIISRSTGARAIDPREPATQVSEPENLPFEQDDPDDTEYRAVAGHIANLMYADEWVEITDQIAEWESSLISTPGGLRFHEIAVEVALSGLQSLLDAAGREKFADLADAEYELGCFVDTYRGSPDNHILAVLAARAHLMIGAACRAAHWPEELGQEAWRRMAHHYVEAGDIVADLDARALMSTLVAEAQYLQIFGAPGENQKVPARFDAWVALDPSNPRTYAIHAEWLADPDNAAADTLRDLADAALDRTEETLGLGGYALFFQPLLKHSNDARAIYDAELYAAAMLDLATLSATQVEVNQTADALAGEIDNYEAEAAPVALKDTLLMLVRSEIKVCYPKIWTRPEDAIRHLIDEAKNTVPDISFDDLSKAA